MNIDKKKTIFQIFINNRVPTLKNVLFLKLSCRLVCDLGFVDFFLFLLLRHLTNLIRVRTVFKDISLFSFCFCFKSLK